MTGTTERNRFWGYLLLVFPIALLLSGCVGQTEVKESASSTPESAFQSELEPLNLAERWRQSISQNNATSWLLDRMDGGQVRTLVQTSLERHSDAKKAVKRLQVARRQTAKAQALMKTVFELNADGGASLNITWEKTLWKTFGKQLEKEHGGDELTDQDLARLRDSLAAQTVKSLFYMQGIGALVGVMEERLEILQQIHGRMKTGHTLGRIDEQAVSLAEASLLKAEQQRDQLAMARQYSVAALISLFGNNPLKNSSSLKAGVKQLPAGLSSTLLTHRPDVQHATDHLASVSGLREDVILVNIPDFPLTGSGGRPAKALNKQLATKKRKVLQKGDVLLVTGLTLTSDEQQQALSGLGKVFVSALLENREQLRRGRQLMGQVEKQQEGVSVTRDEIKAVRARFNAGRSDLTSILEQQIPALRAEGLLSYSRQILQAQRMDSYLALGGLTE